MDLLVERPRKPAPEEEVLKLWAAEWAKEEAFIYVAMSRLMVRRLARS